MTGDEPLPLKAGGEAAPELVRALRALGKRSPDEVMLERVEQALAAELPESVQPPSTFSVVKARLATLVNRRERASSR